MSITIFQHTDGAARKVGLDALPELLASGAKLWIDAEGNDPGLADLLTTHLKLHPMAVEDILDERPIPKVEDYSEYLYIVAHGIVRLGPDDLQIVELDVILTDQWVFTHHDAPSLACQAAAVELTRNGRALERGPAFMAHAVLDHLVDYYLPVIDEIDAEVDGVEHEVLHRPSPEVPKQIFRLKRSLQKMRRVAIHQREVLHRLSRGEFEQIPEKALPFFRDIFDHFVRVADLTDSYRETLSGALDAYLSQVSNRMNEVMKTLTIVSTVMMPLTFVVGVYGMNFDHMPELHWKYGYLAVWILLIAVGAGMYGWFRSKRWI